MPILNASIELRDEAIAEMRVGDDGQHVYHLEQHIGQFTNHSFLYGVSRGSRVAFLHTHKWPAALNIANIYTDLNDALDQTTGDTARIHLDLRHVIGVQE